MTSEQRKISNANHKLAVQYFEWNGELPKNRDQHSYNLHHIDSSWRKNNVERYIQWNPRDLIVLTPSEHCTLHNIGRVYTESHLENLSKSHNIPIKCVETGIVYESGLAAEKALGQCLHISDVINGKRERTGGYHWVRIESEGL